MEQSLIEQGKRLAGYKACEHIREGMILGLGTGSTAYYAIERTGQLVAEGMQLQAVATSLATEELARKWKIPLLGIDEVERLDLVIDGVDEMDADFNAIKGGGGALFREKLVALLGKEVIWVMDDRKLVPALGAFPLPIEILPFGASTVLRKLHAMGLQPRLRANRQTPPPDWTAPSLARQLNLLLAPEVQQQLWVTDNHNYLVDLLVGAPLDLPYLKKELKNIVGVLETGLFLNFCSAAYIGGEGEVRGLVNPNFQKG